MKSAVHFPVAVVLKMMAKLNNSILLYKFVKFAVNKRFDTINFLFTRNDRVWKMRFESRFCYRGEAEVVNPAWDSHFYNKIIPCKVGIITLGMWYKLLGWYIWKIWGNDGVPPFSGTIVHFDQVLAGKNNICLFLWIWVIW